MSRSRGNAAMARLSRPASHEPHGRVKTCTALCRKKEGTCDGCSDSFGAVTEHTRDALEKYFDWWHDTERRRKSLPYLPGQEVQWEGKMWRFQEYRTQDKTRGSQMTTHGAELHCVLYDEKAEAYEVRVPESDIKVLDRQIPLPDTHILRQLTFGRKEFYFLHKKYMKWKWNHENNVYKSKSST